MVDWEVHREVVVKLLKGMAFTAAAAVGFILMIILLGEYPLIALALVIIIIIGGWYFDEYQRVKYRRDLRERTGGTCG